MHFTDRQRGNSALRSLSAYSQPLPIRQNSVIPHKDRRHPCLPLVRTCPRKTVRGQMAFWRGTGPAKLVHRSTKAQRQVGEATSDEHEKCGLKPEFSGSIRQIFSRYCRCIPEQGLCSGIELGAFVISEELPKPDGMRARLKQGGEGGWTQAPKN